MSKYVFEKKMLSFIEKIMRNSVRKEENSWLPICMGFLHQPNRPNRKKEQKNK